MDLLSKKYRQAEEISNLKAEIERLNNCLMESLTHEKNALDVSIKYKDTLQEIKAIVCGNYEIIDPQGRKDILKLITKAEVE